jgi:uncharacterized protein YqeY
VILRAAAPLRDTLHQRQANKEEAAVASNIETQLNDALKEAMKQKDQAVLNVIRQVKTEMTKKKASPGFSAEVNDALWLEIIGAYSKSMQKAKDEFQKGGAAAAEQIKELEFEVQYLSKFLPKQKTEDEVREIVKATIASSGITAKQKAGQLVGLIMKNHKGEIDAALAKRIAEELLA